MTLNIPYDSAISGAIGRLAGARLPRAFHTRPATAVARDLVGMHLVLVRAGTARIGRIVEAEAYEGPGDRAAHSAGGRLTPRTEVMYGAPGHAYVYLIYGLWNCLNVVTAQAGVPHAVLLRALEPVLGIEAPAWGPGLLCKALGIDRRDNGMDLCGDEMWIAQPPQPRRVRVARSPRIGVDYAGDWAQRPWRFYDADSVHISTISAARRRRPTGSSSPKHRR